MEKKPVVFLNEPRVINVTSCSECPNIRWNKPKYQCSKNNERIYKIGIIQIWCPLEKKK